MAIVVEPFGILKGVPVSTYTIEGREGVSATLTDYGASLTRMLVPDRHGQLADVVLGYDSLEHYVSSPGYLGATVGRCANRIRAGRFALDGKTHQLALNEGENHLHGGQTGFDKCLFDATVDEAENAVTFHLVSDHLDEGYPGRLAFSVRYRLTGRALHVVMQASSDRVTIVNTAHHSYWNLAGHASGAIRDHRLMIHADFYSPCDRALLPTGEIRMVEGTRYDFRVARPVFQGDGDGTDGLIGYDNNWCLRDFNGAIRPVAHLCDPLSGRAMTVLSNQPGLQFYSGDRLDRSMRGKGDHAYAACAGLALETQTYPDAANLTHFPSPVLRPGQTYDHRVTFDFAGRDGLSNAP